MLWSAAWRLMWMSPSTLLVPSLLLPSLLCYLCCQSASAALLQIVRTATIINDAGSVFAIGSDGGSIVYWIDVIETPLPPQPAR